MVCEPTAAAARAARFRRVIRLLWPDRNPVRRMTDRVEALILASLAVTFLAAAPLAVIATEHAVYGAAASKAEAERVAWHQVRAVLLENAAALGYSGPEAPALWTSPGGARQTGMVATPAGARSGSTVQIWTDASGDQTGPPLTPTQVRGEAVVFAAFAPVVLGLLLLGAGVLAHVLLARRRLAGWEAEWRATGPQWTRQR
jgi:hypothetical protein